MTATNEPAETDKPAVSEPAATNEPAAADKPAVSEPAATNEPAAADKPAVSEPAAADKPTVSEPAAAKDAAATGPTEPVVVKEPAAPSPVTGAAPSSAGAGAVTPLLDVRGLEAGYGAVRVVRSLDLTADSGTVLGVLGPNGSGKTTMMMTLAGLLPRLGGEVLVDDTPVPGGRPAAANRAGIVLVPDDRALFSDLDVRENLVVARRSGGYSLDDVIELFPSLGKRLDVAAGALSGGEQQMLAVARALVQKPRVLLIDEMSMGLAPVIVEGLLPVVRRIADETGAVVILVEQHVQLALEVADQAIVLVHGEVVRSGPAADLAADRSGLEAAYLGAEAGASA